MLFYISIPVIFIVIFFLSVSLWNRGEFALSAGVAAGATLFTSFLIVGFGIGGIATSISDEQTEQRWDANDIKSFVVDGTTVYSYTSGNTIYEFSTGSVGNTLGTTEGQSYVRKTCGVTPSWVVPWQMGECSKTLFLND